MRNIEEIERYEKIRKRYQKTVKGRNIRNSEIVLKQEDEIEYYRDNIEKLKKQIHSTDKTKLNETITVKIDLKADEDIRKLERIKQLSKEIQEIDNNLSLSNVLEIDKESILVFKTNNLYYQKDIEKIESELSGKLNAKCVLLRHDINIDKAIKFGIDKRTRKRLFN